MQKDNDKKVDERAAEIVSEFSAEVEAHEKGLNFSQFSPTDSFLIGSEPLTKTSEYLSAALGWVYACVTAIADDVANIDIKLFKKVNETDVEEVTTSPILDLLNKANNFTTKFDLFWLTQQYLELTGEAPWLLVREGQEITDILLLRPDFLTVIPGTDQYIDGYKYRIAAGKEVFIPAEDVIFIKYPSPTKPFRGKGTLQAAAKTVDIDNFSEDYNRTFFKNSAMPGSVISTEQKLTKNTIDSLRHGIDKLYKGKDKAHKTMILEQGLDWKPLQMSAKDMDFLKQQTFSRDKILGIFRVPRTVLGITDDVNRANAEATDFIFAKRTIKPKMQRLIDQLNEFLVPMFPDSDKLYLSFVDPVPEDVEAKLKANESGIKNGYLTINEVRQSIGKESIGDEGDVIYLPFNLQPIDAKSEPSNEEAKSIIRKIGYRNRKALAVTKRKNAVEAKIADHLEPIIKQMITGEVKQEVNPKVCKNQGNAVYENFWKVKIAKAEDFEKQMIKDLSLLFAEQEKEVLAKMPKKAVSKNPEKWRLDEDGNVKKTKSLLKRIEELVILAGSREAFELIDIDDEIDPSNPAAQKFLEEKTFKTAESVTKTTNNKLGKTLSEGVEKGEGIPSLRKRVQEVFVNATKSRAEAIARSEVMRATNWATEEAYKESGVVESKEWLTAMDERVCQWCRPLDGKTVKIGEPFFDKGATFEGDEGGEIKLDFETVETPPLHVRCRCTIVPVIK